MSATSPGWYPDPQNPSVIRFFDGKEWTHETAPAPTDGQLSPEIIARGHQIMAARSGQSWQSGSSPTDSSPAGAASAPQGPADASRSPESSPAVSQPYAGFTEDGGLSDAAADRKAPGWVWPVIGISALASVGIAVAAPALIEGSTSGPAAGAYVASSELSKDYATLELPSSYTCDDLFDELFLGGAFDDANGDAVIGATSPSLIDDARADFTLPAGPEEYSLLLTCSGVAEYDTGESKDARFELSASSDRNLWVIIEPR